MEIPLLISVLLLDLTSGNDIHIMKTNGLIEFKQPESSTETITWMLHPPENRTNVVLSISMIDYRIHNRWSFSQIYFPDGSHDKVPENSYLDTAFCRVFVKSATSGKNTCQADVAITDICKEPSLESQTWPPILSAKLKQYSLLMYFEFVECRGSETGTTTSSMITDETSIAITSLSSKTTNDVTSAPIYITQSSNESHQSCVQSRVESSEALLYTLIAILTLLMIAVILLGVTAWKYRNQKRDFNSTSANLYYNQSDKVGEIPFFGDKYHARNVLRSANELREEIGGNLHLEKRTIENMLYRSSEKEDVVNELYFSPPANSLSEV